MPAADDSKVTGLRGSPSNVASKIEVPQLGLGGTPTLAFPRTAISASGKFTATGEDMIGSGPLAGSVAATFKISGTFTADGREHGVITTKYSGAAKRCSGSSAYSTRAAG